MSNYLNGVVSMCLETRNQLHSPVVFLSSPYLLTIYAYSIPLPYIVEVTSLETIDMLHKNKSKQYTVWKLRFNLAMQDPDIAGTRYRTTIFVETDSGGSGVMSLEISPLA
jgi:hypothetical protein